MVDQLLKALECKCSKHEAEHDGYQSARDRFYLFFTTVVEVDRNSEQVYFLKSLSY